MKKTFKLVGLDCANCAAKIEDKIGKLEGVSSATVNFMTTKLVIEAEDDKMDGIVDAAKAIVKKFEPDVVVQKA
ncbi:MAG TPA: heavy metal transporter [Clostridiales bacterium]|nr:heavy metal transporter [Clostridiales bacterium]